MKQSEIKEMVLNDLKDRIETEKTLLKKMKINHVISPIENPSKITLTRKNIAKLKTELRRRELEANS